MLKINVTVTGREKLSMAPQIIKNIILELAQAAEGQMKEIAPIKSGRLRSSIKHKITKGGFGATVGPRVKYGAAQEYGLPPGPGRYVPAIGKRLIPSGRGFWPGFKGSGYVKTTQIWLDTFGNRIAERILQQWIGGTP